jgi:hypothetical protein
MKTIGSVILLMVFYLAGNCQIINTSNSWNYLEVLMPTCKKSTDCEGTSYQNYNYTIGGDTLINNKVYTKVIATIVRYNDTVYNNHIAGFLREEENHKKVYSLLSYIDDSTEVLLYDFTVKKDSIFSSTYKVTWNLPEGDETQTDTFYRSRVMDVDTVFYQGTKRLRIIFSDFRLNWFEDEQVGDTLEWIEGIGSNHGLLDYRYISFSLLCFKQNDELKYNNRFGLDCEYSGPLDISENHVIKDIMIYPNPLKGEALNISSSNLISRILIYNISGELVGQFFPENTQYQIRLDNLNCGFYIINVNNYFFKLIIE